MNNIYDPKYVKNLFNGMSSSYERMNYITSFGFSIRWRKQFLNNLGKSKDNLNVIDILSGLGENWWYLKKRFPNATFYALDFSEEMIMKSKNKVSKVFKGDMTMYCENIMSSSLQSESFDVISCAYGLKTFSDEQLHDLAREIRRLLKPHGIFSFVEVSVPEKKWLANIYKFYLGKVIPALGRLFLGNPDDYKMLWVYTENFVSCDRVVKIFEEYGLRVKKNIYFFGCATGITGTHEPKFLNNKILDTVIK